MAKKETVSLTINSTGNKTFVLADSTLQVEKVVLCVSDSSSVASFGYGDETTNFTGGTAYGDENDTYSITHYRNVSGTKTKIIEGVIPSNSFNTVGEFVLNVSTLATPVQVKGIVYGS